MALKIHVKRLRVASVRPDDNDAVLVQRTDLQRLLREFVQIAEALRELEYQTRQQGLWMPNDVQNSVKLLRPQKRSK